MGDSMTCSYEAPQVTLVGSVHELTLGFSTGAALDHDFPAGTLFGDLTFS
jgi:hypothetical protein